VVLIVDDVPNNLLALEAMLRRDDVEILTALSGRAALDILLERDVALALIDVRMPEMDGFELATLMRGVEKTRYVPIVFITAASGDLSRVFKGYESGAVDYMFMPVDPQILRGKVDVFVTLEKHRLQLQHADRMREMFIGILGHDLRNPLSSIIMSAQLVLRRSDDEAIAAALERILRNGDRMLNLIDQVLDFGRVRLGGGIALSPAQADLRWLTDQVLGEFDHLRQRFQVEVSGNTVGTWDTDRLLQALSNLIGNAVHHSPSGSPIRIVIQGRRENTVDLQVHNAGAPIPEDLRDQLFEPFRSSRSSGNGLRRSQRLGLGLYITKQIVLAHGGTLTFESSEESGTCFFVRVPRYTIGEANKVEVARAAADRQPGEYLRARKTILIVEDDRDARIALRILLQDLGYHVLEASEPSEALALVDGHDGPVHLLLTDLNLPEMAGDVLATHLRNSHPELEVIFMSGLPDAPAAASTFIQKPIHFDALAELIERTLA